MNDLERKAAEVQLGVLKLQYKLLESRLKGDLPGHPFRGNQYSGGGGSFGRDRSRTDFANQKLEEIQKNAQESANLAMAAAKRAGELEGIKKRTPSAESALQKSQAAFEASKSANDMSSHKQAAKAHGDAMDAHLEAEESYRRLGNSTTAMDHRTVFEMHRRAWKYHADAISEITFG